MDVPRARVEASSCVSRAAGMQLTVWYRELVVMLVMTQIPHPNAPFVRSLDHPSELMPQVSFQLAVILDSRLTSVFD